ncbi:MAG: type II secretion system F family protein [Acidobacteriaceae bacterium]|jgi:tight adherence protein B
MAVLILTFVSILLATFALVVVVTRQSADEKIVGQRMAWIHLSQKAKAGAGPDSGQLLKETKRSRLGWLDEFLSRFQFAQSLQVRILQANSSTSVSGLILTSQGLLLVGTAITWLFAPMILIDLAVGAVLSLLPFGILSLKRTRRVNAFDAALPECIDMLARALRAGHSVVGALEMLASNAQEPAAFEFGEVFKQLNLGLPMRNALLQLLDRVPSPDLRVLVTAIMVQKDTGGNLVEILDRTVFVIRERLRIQGEIRVETAQGRLTGWILTALPVVMMVLLNLVNPGYSSILFHDELGRKLIYISLGMLGVGSLIIRKIVNGIEV